MNRTLATFFGLLACANGASVITKGASLPKTLYQRSLFAYSFLDSSPLTISYVGTGSGKGKAALKAGETEFGGSDSLFKASDYEAVPDLQMYPTAAAAVVPIYNLPEIDHLSGSLVLRRQTLARIYLGNITMWNDPSILADNFALLAQGAVFPAVPIRLFVRSGKSGTTEILKKALTSFSAEFAANGDTSSQPTWPTAVSRVSSSLLGPAVAMTPHSLGYSVLDSVIQLKLSKVELINRAGHVVAASSGSIGAALEELGGSLDARFNAAIFDSGAAGAWPIAGYTYLILRRNTTISNCGTRRAALRFWEWFYSDPTPSRLALRLGFATLPCAVSERVLAHMRQHTLCGSPPQQVFSSTGVRGRGPEGAAPLLRTLATAYGAFQPALALSYSGDSRNRADLAKEVAAGANIGSATAAPAATQFAVAFDHNDGAADTESQNNNGSLSVPLAASAVGIAYHADSLLVSDASAEQPPPLILDVALVADMLSGRVSSWDHPRLVALNPGLTLPSSPIVLVTCTGHSESARAVSGALRRLLGSASPLPVSASSDSWGGIGGIVRRVGSEEAVVSAVAFLPHTIAVVSTMNSKQLSLAQLQLTPTDGGAVLVSPTVHHVSACVAEGSVASAMASLQHAGSEGAAAAAGCWPFTSMLSLVFPSSYTTPTEAHAQGAVEEEEGHEGEAHAAALSGVGGLEGALHCPVAVATQRYLRWLFQGGEVAALLSTMGVAPLPDSHHRAVKSLQDRLTCNGARLLTKPACTASDFTASVSACDAATLSRNISHRFLVEDELERGCAGSLPPDTTVHCAAVLWESSPATAITVLTATLVAICLLLMMFVVLNSSHAVIAYSQPRFCLLVLFGAACTALSVLPFLGPNTDTSCTLRPWGTSLAFTIMFGALLLKIHRAYRLLTNEKLRSFTIKAAVLYSRLAALLAVDVLLLTLRQLLSPPGAELRAIALPPSVVAAIGSPAMVSECKADGSGMMFAVIAFKAVLLLVGTVLSVKAWGLQSSMAESKHLAVAIYNTTFVAVMVLLLTQAGFSLPPPMTVQLQCGAILWCVLVTLTLLFVPKLRKVGLSLPTRSNSTGKNSRRNTSSYKRTSPRHTAGGSPPHRRHVSSFYARNRRVDAGPAAAAGAAAVLHYYVGQDDATPGGAAGSHGHTLNSQSGHFGAGTTPADLTCASTPALPGTTTTPAGRSHHGAATPTTPSAWT